MRGYAAIGLFAPKIEANVGGAMRAAHCYGATLVVVCGGRYHRCHTDTVAAYRHIPLLHTDDMRASVPMDCKAVAVDLIEGACPLPSYQHPQRAFYIFGPENGTLGADVLRWCDHRIVVPTNGCMNLAATVNVVLYDRAAKIDRMERRRLPP